MALTTQDFQARLDITGLTAVTGTSIMQVTETAFPANDKGLIIETQDSASDIPVVPDPNTLLEGITPTYWGRYIWKRVSFDPDEAVKHYTWNQQLTMPDATYLNWEWIEEDAETALANAAIALSTANAASVLATTASTAAATAQTAATAAQATANFALTDAAIAQSTADAANVSIGVLQTTVAGLTVTVGAVQSDLATLTTKVARVPLGSFYIREQANSGVNGQNSVAATWTKRLFTNIDLDNASLTGYCTLNGDSTLDLLAGVWSIEGEFPCNGGGTGQYHKTKLVDDTAVADLLFGTSEYADTTIAATRSKIRNVISLGATTKIEVQHKGSQSIANAFGIATSMGPEIYGQLKLSYLGAV